MKRCWDNAHELCHLFILNNGSTNFHLISQYVNATADSLIFLARSGKDSDACTNRGRK